METTNRPYATAGIALVAASLIAITPVATTPTDVRTAAPPVSLSAIVDPIATWQNVFDKSEANLSALVKIWEATPAVVLQQVIVNQMGYVSQLPDFETISAEIRANLDAARKAATAKDLTTINALKRFAFSLLPRYFPGGVIPPEAQPLVDFTTSYLSGALLGLVGPAVGPALVAVKGFQAIADNLSSETPDPEAALSTLLNLPAGMTDAFLNGGQHLDLTPLLTALELPMPANTTMGIAFGGVLSPGGSMFAALDMGMGGLKLAGVGVGTIGSLLGMSKVIAKAIGWDGTGNPLDPPAKAVAAAAPVAANDPGQLPTAGVRSQTFSLPALTDSGRQQAAVATQNLTETTDEDTSGAAESDQAHSPVRVKRERTGSGLSGAVKKAGDRVGSAVSGLGKKSERGKALKKPSASASSDTKGARSAA